VVALLSGGETKKGWHLWSSALMTPGCENKIRATLVEVSVLALSDAGSIPAASTNYISVRQFRKYI